MTITDHRIEAAVRVLNEFECGPESEAAARLLMRAVFKAVSECDVNSKPTNRQENDHGNYP